MFFFVRLVLNCGGCWSDLYINFGIATIAAAIAAAAAEVITMSSMATERHPLDNYIIIYNMCIKYWKYYTLGNWNRTRGSEKLYADSIYHSQESDKSGR